MTQNAPAPTLTTFLEPSPFPGGGAQESVDRHPRLQRAGDGAGIDPPGRGGTVAQGLAREIICINDCSKDNTGAKLDELPQLFPGVDFKIVHKPVNEGKGAALRDGFRAATGDIVLVQDADLEYDPQDYLKLIGPIADNKADVVFGSRFIGEPHRVLYFYHTLGKSVFDILQQHVHQSEPHGHGSLL